jgi:holo-[acyl-carrier protein] synthase
VFSQRNSGYNCKSHPLIGTHVIIGIGIDLIGVEAWRRFLKNYFDEFCCQCFTPREQAQIQSCKDPFVSAGLHFAIKEAMLKAIGIGLQEGVAWEDIEVLTLSHYPTISIKAACQKHAQTLGIQEFLIGTAVLRNKTILASAIASDGT